MKLISFGDKIKPGNYAFLSRFRNILNFVLEDEVISLGNRNIQKGPTNIIVDCLDFPKIHSLIIEDKFINIDNIKLKIDKYLRFNSEMKISRISFQKLSDYLGIIEVFLKENAHPRSLAFLLDGRREENFQSGFDKIFVETLKAGLNKILSENILEGVEQFKGKGFGLTPSGDDFICGMLYGIYLIQVGKRIDLTKLREEVFKKAISNNLISNNFLRMANEGRFFEHFMDFINSQNCAKGYKSSQWSDSLKKIISVGETSGSDMLTGFLITMKREI